MSTMDRTKQIPGSDNDFEVLAAPARAAWEAKHPGEAYPGDGGEREDGNGDEVSSTATAVTYRTLNELYDLLNQALFGGGLPECLITLQRHKNSKGYFGHQRFAHRRGSGIVDEIALNPETFQGRTDREIASTLVHEMVHCWQYHFGGPSRNGYHNLQWADKMLALGLIPSSTGEPGGKQTGQKMTHYIAEEGPFDREWWALEEAGYRIDYQDSPANRSEQVRKAKTNYTCLECAAAVWGKPGLRIICEDCGRRME